MKMMRQVLWMTLLVSVLLATAALARPVYLKSGGVVQAQKVWQEDGKVYVLLNRDSLTYFNPDEVNLQKTFATGPRHKAARVAAAPAPRRVAAAPAPAPAPAKPAVAVAPAATAPTPAPAATAAPPAGQAPVATQAAQPPASAVAPAATKPAGPPPTAPAQTAVASAKPAAPPATAQAPTAPKKPQSAAVKPPKKPLPPAKSQQGNGAFAIGFLVGLLVVALLVIAGFWKVFVKAGEAGWKSLVPIYNLLVLLRIAGCPAWWLLPIFIPVVNLYFLVMLHLRLAEKFGKSHLFGFGLCLLGFVFFPILGFGSAVYQATGESFTFEEDWGDAPQEAPDETRDEP